MSNLPDIFAFTRLSQLLPLEDAIDQAIRQTPEHFILRKYLQAHKTEVKGMLWEEYDKEEYKRLFRKEYVQEGIEIGRQEGRAEGRQLILLQMISAKIKKGKTAAQIAEELDIEPGEVQFLAELIQRHPGMSCEDLCAIEISTAV